MRLILQYQPMVLPITPHYQYFPYNHYHCLAFISIIPNFSRQRHFIEHDHDAANLSKRLPHHVRGQWKKADKWHIRYVMP